MNALRTFRNSGQMSRALQHRQAIVCDGQSVHNCHVTASLMLRRYRRKWHQRIAASQQDVDLAISQAVDATSASLVDRAFADNWKAPLEGYNNSETSCRPIVCLGKFDALHKGHQSLAAAALALGGSPVLLSFSGMGAVLGWQPRKPLVAPCDRPRVLNLWAQQLSQQQQQQQQQVRDVQGNCAGVPPSDLAAATLQPIRQHYIPFAAIRSMSPDAFVQLLQQELGAAGVVAGINYRFGYRAAGDSSLLQQLCAAAGLPSHIVELVGAAEPGAVGVVSSSKIREMLATCRIEAARKSLGRQYRLVAAVQLPLSQQQQQQQHMWPADIADNTSAATKQQNQQMQELSSSSSSRRVVNTHKDALFIPHEQLLNQHPGPGVYQCNVQLYLGATAHDDLLQLQTAAAVAAAAAAAAAVHQRQAHASDAEQCSNGSGLGPVQLLRGLQVPGSSCCAAVTMSSQQVVVTDNGVALPLDVLKLSADALGNCDTGGSSSSSSISGTADVGVSKHTSYSNSSISLSSSSSTRSEQNDVSLVSSDPCCWDTDDNDDSSGSDGDESATMPALLVLDFERCLQQTCSIQASCGTAAAM